jgi:hypothetical protein
MFRTLDSDRFEDIVIQSLFDAAARARITVFANIMLSAVILVNFYIQAASFDDQLVYRAEHRIMEADSKMQTFSANNRCRPIDFTIGLCAAGQKVHPPYMWNAENLKQYSFWASKKAKAENALKNYTLPTIEIPLLGFPLSTNDANIICGIFLMCISAWVLFSVRQISYSYEDDHVRGVIQKYGSALSHIYAIANPANRALYRYMVWAVVFLPVVSLAIAAIWDVLSLAYYKWMYSYEYDVWTYISVSLTLLIAVGIYFICKSIYFNLDFINKESRRHSPPSPGPAIADVHSSISSTAMAR